MNELAIVGQPVSLRQVSTRNGHIAWVPEATYKAIADAGGGELTIVIDSAGEAWLTVTEAAAELLDDIDGLDIDRAIKRVSNACANHKFTWRGHRKARRIDPISFRAWRLKLRQRELDRMDD